MANKPETKVTEVNDNTVKVTDDGLSAELTAAEKKFYAALMKEGSVTIEVGTESQKKSKGYVDAGINGIFWRLKYGTEYTVPKAVAKQLKESGYAVTVVGAF